MGSLQPAETKCGITPSAISQSHFFGVEREGNNIIRVTGQSGLYKGTRLPGWPLPLTSLRRLPGLPLAWTYLLARLLRSPCLPLPLVGLVGLPCRPLALARLVRLPCQPLVLVKWVRHPIGLWYRLSWWGQLGGLYEPRHHPAACVQLTELSLWAGCSPSIIF